MKAGAVGKFLLVFIAYSMLHTGSSASGNETDRLSLLDFKKAITLDPQQVLASWNDSTHFCSWEGILCTANNPRRVASIRLERRSLVGQISPSLGNLTFLRNLSLATNQFTGEIPASLGHLQYLQYLYLSNNTLQGQIPSFANCSSLRVMWLHRNGLVGQFPADLPSGLRQLQISVNNLSGTIPASLSNITKLAVISCAYNNFVGNVPDEFAKLSNMQQLYLGANQLSGRFPRAIMNFSALTDLSLGLNEFSGEVPPDLGSVLRNLLLFELPVNFFHGPIPPSLTNASNLYYIEISRNNFTGLVPSTIEKLNKLEMLNLEYNQLQAERKQDWEFLGSLANCTELIDFSMTGNRLRGKVPASVGNLTNQLQYLYMSENQLSGEFPPGTIGYVAPECAGGGQVSTASDVYSFGVVLLEVFIRRRPTDDMFKEEMSITKFTEINFPENVLQIVDPQLLQELDLSMEIPTTIKETGAEILQSVLEVGLCCTRTSPKERINMQVAAAKLHGIRDAYLRGN
ncbi:hypothetical protein QOZ80_9BG0694660 [Eleusine coracana subsp. coracana]|nr:hypothetical protein QOZ80_9BG0694660 [Eleusine coracana subsp. coracana]